MPSEDANLLRDVRRLERPPGPGSQVARYYAEDIELEVAFQGGREDANATGLHGREQVRSYLGMPGSEAEVSPQPFAYVMTLHDRRVARIQDYPDRAEALRAVGQAP